MTKAEHARIVDWRQRILELTWIANEYRSIDIPTRIQTLACSCVNNDVMVLPFGYFFGDRDLDLVWIIAIGTKQPNGIL